MARIRTIKPDFFRNEQLAELPYEDRLLFAGLWTLADKAGRLEDRPKRIKGELFPYDDLNVDAGLGRLANAGLILRYEVNGSRLLCVPTWEKHQRPHHTEACSVIPGPDGSPCDHGDQPEGRERNGREQEGKGTDSALRARFERFWAEFPRKVGKDAAWAAWQRRHPDDALTDVMVSAVREQSRSPQWRRDGGQYIPHPRTWLHQGRWQDAADRAGVSSDGLDGLREAVRHG